MAINGKAIVEKLQATKRPERERFTLYLAKDVYAEFTRKCGDLPAGNVVEELMREFIASAPEPAEKPKKAKR